MCLLGTKNIITQIKQKLNALNLLGKSDDGKMGGAPKGWSPSERDRKGEGTLLVCCAWKFDKIQGINTLKYTKKQ